ncbi:MAG: sn-glycerol-3-phosphate ABC transporter ATP-binding protein UgpC [Rhodocyclaceae bacterium]|nr:sn-glycerol-3-phosphate ABC transporter ATP-binding protein UgpC [Rhodocyclaceae bacterium]MCP5233191.1 sn-glycerol-3-phosphate ABC transporter ATP-binding protein UgpC [Zoogloeaceae bacterium]MCP5239371.1 sn-glycerol-3-phosphate ABC transporter ATP-binding protein UgpC [Zoogloeaceae bacterium]MCP5254861.1 sn-glycerol-3-phosphate ABC transporter ATP-binding protein UgpC [Zoogloeaceae bacterium]MCP5295570.1 sn-glycerol-3-phosphate ABC transporter ATP-binding protein UgpC [Zoogloeaceae bacteri
MAANVSLRNVAKHFGAVKVVDNISLEIEPGEFVVLVGPSGCGKSTTLRLVAGLEQISDGTISIDNRVVNNLAPKDRGVAMVFQNYALYPHLTVRDNISFGLRLGRMSKADIDAEVTRAASILELGPLLDRRPSDLSGGQRQRVAMGRAIVRNPSVFLFDEPLSNLDAKLRTQMRAEIKRLHSRLRNTVIYVTHDQLEAMTLADRIVVMRGGVIEQMGTPKELFDAPVSSFVAGFMGSPPMNLTPCSVVSNGDATSVTLGGTEKLSLPPAAREAINGTEQLTFGVRPEDIRLQPREGTQPINGLVELVEPLGGESLVHVRVGDDLFVMRAEGRTTVESDRPITLHLDMQRIYLFDRKGGRRVYHDMEATS